MGKFIEKEREMSYQDLGAGLGLVFHGHGVSVWDTEKALEVTVVTGALEKGTQHTRLLSYTLSLDRSS